ncbi:MAG: hypothetical protein LBT50_08030 [Prevotellaceae bacterium]|jgi:hypothetical protein|nr:hypothetical protein [Prevotellaceae bacterium]
MKKINKEIIMLIAPIALFAFIFIILNGNNEGFSEKDSYWLILIIIITFVIMGFYMSNVSKELENRMFIAEANKIKRAFSYLLNPIIIIAGIMFLIKYIDNFFISGIVSMILLFGSILLRMYYFDPKKFVIDEQGIRCVLSWNLKWVKVKNLDFDENKRTLTIV